MIDTNAAAAALIACAALAPARAQEITASAATGVDYSIGDFGLDEDTTLIAVPLSLRAKRGDWSLQAAASFVSVDGPGVFDGEQIVPGLDFCDREENQDRFICRLQDFRGNGRGATQNDDGAASGFSDVIVSLNRGFAFGPDAATTATLSGGVKLPTGDEDKGLSTGAVDGRLRATVEQALGDDYFALGSVGYVLRGDNDDTEFNNTLALQAGLGGYWGRKWVYSVEADYRQASIDDVEDAAEAGVYLTRLLTSRVAVVGYAYAGLTDTSPDVGGGLSLSVQLTP